MYKKKDNKVMIIAVLVVIVIVALLYLIPGIVNGTLFRGRTEPETEPVEYEVLIHKTDAGKIDVKKSWLKSDGESETKLSVAPGTLVSLSVTPNKNKVLESVQVVQAKEFMNEIQTIVSETKENTYTVDFSMPEADVIMNFRFETMETDAPEPETVPVKESESESETEKKEGNPYDLTVHGITADLITSFNGQFDDRDFCQQLGDALHLDSPGSEYYGVTDVTFSRDTYTGERDSDKVYYYIYFGEDPDWKLLSTYYLKDRTYLFTKYEEPETEEKDRADSGNGGEDNVETGNNYNYNMAGTGTAGSGSYTAPVTTSTTSFDILQVSKTFLAFTGDQEAFYSKAFDYVLSKGLTGKITGTMSSYEIDPETQTAKIVIKLNTGGSFTCSFDKKKKVFSFSGL